MPDGPSALAGDTATMVPETHELSTRAIVLITLGAISATITLLAIIWYAYSTLRKRTDISQRRKLSRKSRSLSIRTQTESQLPSLEKTASASEAFHQFPSSPNPSIITLTSPDLEKLYPISPAMLSTGPQSPNAQVIFQSMSYSGSTGSGSIPTTPTTPSTLKSLDLRKLWPISPTMLSNQSPDMQMTIRSAVSEQDLELGERNGRQGVKPSFHVQQ